MKTFTLLFLVVVSTTLVLSKVTSKVDKKLIGTEGDPKQLFSNFMTAHNKKYSVEETAKRFQIFQNNLKKIQELNKVHARAVFGVTKFADLDSEEFKSMYLNKKNNARPDAPVMANSEFVIGDIPTSFDWRDKGAVTDVYDQAQCGSCWAFSATEAIESQWFLAGNSLVSLSPQQIVDCDQGRGDLGCDGGDTPTAYEYVIAQGGMVPWSDYPYSGEDGTCQFKSSQVAAKISNWTYIAPDKNETVMQYALYNKGPLSICVDAQVWQFYFGGVIQTFCGTELDHCVLLVGYEDYTTWFDETVPIWMIRNSWGGDWGEAGYIYVERGSDLCGVAEEVTLPIV